MPLMSTFAALSKNGFIGTILKFLKAIGIFSTKLDNANFAWYNPSVVNNSLFQYGNQAYGSLSRPSYLELSTDNEILLTYKIYADTSSNPRIVNGVTKDLSGNSFVLWNTPRLFKYDSSNNFVQGVDFSITGFTNLGLIRDTGGYLYFSAYESGTNLTHVFKIDPITLSVIWCKRVNTTAFGNNAQLYINGIDDLYLVGSPDGIINYLLKMDNAGTIQWQKVINNFQQFAPLSFDNNNNPWLFSNVAIPPSTRGARVIRIDNFNGNKISELYVYENSFSIYLPKYDNFIVNGTNIILLSSQSTTIGKRHITSMSNGGVLYQHTEFANFETRGYTGSLYACMTKNASNTFINGTVNGTGSYPVMMTLKLPANAVILGTYTYDANFQTDNGTNITANGSITFTALPAAYLTITNTSVVTVTASSLTISSISITTSAVTESLGTQTPFVYVKPI